MNNMKFKLLKIFIASLIPLFIFPSCGTKRTIPISGRKIRIAEGAYSDGQMLEQSKAYYPYAIKKYGNLSSNKQNVMMVKRVANNLIDATNKYLKDNGYNEDLKYFEWEVNLVDSKIPNAFCMAGGKIVVLEGILPVAKDENGLAAILGHEIGHAIAHHSAEQCTKDAKKKVWQSVGALGIGIAGVATKADMNVVGDVTAQIVDLSNEVMQYVEQRYSRKQEFEADRIGLMLMALAGYDPREAPKLWTRMTEMYGETPGTLLDSHPSNKKRKREMEEKWMSEALRYYNSSKNAAKMTSNQGYGQNTAKSRKNSTIENKRYKVTASKLNIRVDPSTNSTVIGSFSKGQIITVESISNGWATIKYNGKTAYVSVRYITLEN